MQIYLDRMVWKVDLREVQERRAAPPGGLVLAEAGLLLQALGESGRIIALDERGDDCSSADFAELLRRWRDDGETACGFALGGADGLHPDVRKRADRIIRFGRQTWPHMLARVMLAEQLYRAQQILAGHPYHRE
jgi:23S rRNA (pseudouridine1915-N3)-methyltransferase